MNQTNKNAKSTELSLKELNQQLVEWEKQEEIEFRKSQNLPELPIKAAVGKSDNSITVTFLKRVK